MNKVPTTHNKSSWGRLLLLMRYYFSYPKKYTPLLYALFFSLIFISTKHIQLIFTYDFEAYVQSLKRHNILLESTLISAIAILILFLTISYRVCNNPAYNKTYLMLPAKRWEKFLGIFFSLCPLIIGGIITVVFCELFFHFVYLSGIDSISSEIHKIGNMWQKLTQIYQEEDGPSFLHFLASAVIMYISVLFFVYVKMKSKLKLTLSILGILIIPQLLIDIAAHDERFRYNNAVAFKDSHPELFAYGLIGVNILITIVAIALSFQVFKRKEV